MNTHSPIKADTLASSGTKIVHPNAELARMFKLRSESHNLKGKRRDNALMDFWAGAFCALAMAGHEDAAQNVARLMAMVLSVRGYQELDRIIESAAKKESIA